MPGTKWQRNPGLRQNNRQHCQHYQRLTCTTANALGDSSSALDALRSCLLSRSNRRAVFFGFLRTKLKLSRLHYHCFYRCLRSAHKPQQARCSPPYMASAPPILFSHLPLRDVANWHRLQHITVRPTTKTQASAEMLNGRWFAGRMVLVEYLNPKVGMHNKSL